MIDHIGFAVSNFLHSKKFYLSALEPLGIGIVMEVTPEQSGGSAHLGFGDNGKPYFWIDDGEGMVRGRLHIAFAAKTRAAVDAFYQAAIAAGGKDNGKPGPRPHYHEHYYGAFVLDPDGHNIEAVCHNRE
jgi:catechol 2,3-dioxygenase-like lactoylglutathione lyase family enzyme